MGDASQACVEKPAPSDHFYKFCLDDRQPVVQVSVCILVHSRSVFLLLQD